MEQALVRQQERPDCLHRCRSGRRLAWAAIENTIDEKSADKMSSQIFFRDSLKNLCYHCIIDGANGSGRGTLTTEQKEIASSATMCGQTEKLPCGSPTPGGSSPDEESGTGAAEDTACPPDESGSKWRLLRVSAKTQPIRRYQTTQKQELHGEEKVLIHRDSVRVKPSNKHVLHRQTGP